jgi:hypothetical protein
VARSSLAALFADDPLSAVLAVLRDAGPAGSHGLRAEQVKAALLARGVPADALRTWRRVQARLVTCDRVSVGGDRYRRTYRYLAEPPRPSPAQALALLAGHRLPSPRRAQLVEVLRVALDGGPSDQTLRELRELAQREKDALRVLVEMAIEIEELATNQASARALVHTVRTRTRAAKLEPVERAGESTLFDRTRHQSVAGPIADAAPVVVVRPGYTWNGPTGKVLVARAVVQDRSTH